VGIDVTSGTKGGFQPPKSWGKPKKVRPFGMPTVPYDPATGKFLALAPEADDELSGQGSWIEVNVDLVTVSSTSRLSISDTTGLFEGFPLRYLIGSTMYYGIIDAVVEDSYVDVRGAPIIGELVSLEVGPPERVTQLDFFVSGECLIDGEDDALLADYMYTYFSWNLPGAYLVAISATVSLDDTVSDPYVNVSIDGNNVCSDSAGAGVAAIQDSWTDSSLVGIYPNYYNASWRSLIEIACTVAGGGADASDLTVSCTFVVDQWAAE